MKSLITLTRDINLNSFSTHNEKMTKNTYVNFLRSVDTYLGTMNRYNLWRILPTTIMDKLISLALVLWSAFIEWKEASYYTSHIASRMLQHVKKDTS